MLHLYIGQPTIFTQSCRKTREKHFVIAQMREKHIYNIRIKYSYIKHFVLIVLFSYSVFPQRSIKYLSLFYLFFCVTTNYCGYRAHWLEVGILLIPLVAEWSLSLIFHWSLGGLQTWNILGFHGDLPPSFLQISMTETGQVSSNFCKVRALPLLELRRGGSIQSYNTFKAIVF